MGIIINYRDGGNTELDVKALSIERCVTAEIILIGLMVVIFDVCLIAVSCA